MPWMSVTGIDSKEMVINTDAIVRFQKAHIEGTVIWLTDGMVQVSDRMEEIVQALLKADEKKK